MERKLQHSNATSHSARYTTEYLARLGIRNEKMMIWPPSLPDLHPIENLWRILKEKIYADGKDSRQKMSCGKL